MNRFERTAIDAAHRGGEVLRRHFRRRQALHVESKGLHDFVTEVDREAEGAVLQCIRDVFPDHEIMAEESAPEVLHTGRHRWVVDPLDGTTNFIHGLPTFSVSVAVEDDRGLLAGAIHDPHNGETFHGSRGEGTKLNGEAVRCGDPEEPGRALVATGFPFRELSRLAPYMSALETFIRTSAGIRRAGSAALDLAYTACGRYDGFWEVGLSRWDIAAGVLLVREAGGKVTDVTGGDAMLQSGDIVAAGPRFHALMLETTRAAFAQ